MQRVKRILLAILGGVSLLVALLTVLMLLLLGAGGHPVPPGGEEGDQQEIEQTKDKEKETPAKSQVVVEQAFKAPNSTKEVTAEMVQSGEALAAKLEGKIPIFEGKYQMPLCDFIARLSRCGAIFVIQDEATGGFSKVLPDGSSSAGRPNWRFEAIAREEILKVNQRFSRFDGNSKEIGPLLESWRQATGGQSGCLDMFLPAGIECGLLGVLSGLNPPPAEVACYRGEYGRRGDGGVTLSIQKAMTRDGKEVELHQEIAF